MRLFPILAFAVAFLGAPEFSLCQGQPVGGFHISIIDGEGALNNVKGRIAREPIVQVEDKNHRPVVGAYVVFDTPTTGASGTFANGATQFVTNTDEYGQAIASGLRPNQITGSFDIHVHVTYQGQSLGEATIHQVNVAGKLAQLSKNLNTNSASAAVEEGMIGVVVGNDFLVDGSSAPAKANLADGARIQTRGQTIKLYLHDGCEFLIAPHSNVSVAPSLLNLHAGVLRARHIANCKVAYGGLLILGLENSADGVVGVAASGLQVGALTGRFEVRGGNGSVVDTVNTGTVSSFGNAASGVANAAAPASTHLPLYYLAVLGASLGGLGVAIETLSQAPRTTLSP